MTKADKDMLARLRSAGFPFREYTCAGTHELVAAGDQCDRCEPAMPGVLDLMRELRQEGACYKVLVMPTSVACVTPRGDYREPFDTMELALSDYWLMLRGK